jgi:DNA-binding transcriptional LysR family regulator
MADRRLLITCVRQNPVRVVFGVEKDSVMRRSEFADLTAFVSVATHLSFRAAAARLGVTPSALSHTVRQLEERLGVRLLHRTTRSVSPTDAGQRLLERLRPAMDEVMTALEDLKREQQRPSGRLRIHATHLAAMTVIAPIWNRFLSTYPEVEIELQVNQGPVDTVAKGFDAGIGSRDRAAADMIVVRVMGPTKLVVVGSPAYIADRRPPLTPDDLAVHSCIQFRRADGALFEWSFARGSETRSVSVGGRVTVNSADLGVRAAVDGLGLAYVIEPVAAPYLASGQLVRVLTDWSPAFQGLFLYYPGRRQIPAALRAFIDMIRRAHETPAANDLGALPEREAKQTG